MSNDSIATMLASNRVEKLLETNKWVHSTPYLNFGEGIEVCPIFPYCGAQARLLVRSVKDHNKTASIYFDTHDVLGIANEPYWEVYTGTTYRYKLDKTNDMVKFIRKELLDKPKKSKIKTKKKK